MPDIIRYLGPGPRDKTWREAQGLLAASETRIGHIDSGLFPHKTLGFDEQDRPPPYILMDQGLNVFDPGGAAGDAPLSPMQKPQSGIGGLTEYPDHGVKTLSIILANKPGVLIGVAPEAKIIPYRVANGPLFVRDADTSAIGEAMHHAMDLKTPPRVFSLSIGNPGVTGPFEILRLITGGSAGMQEPTLSAINRAYDEGIILVCAAGQVIKQLIYPARFARTIAVGGITSEGTHYPNGGYKNSGEPDVWALATNINRAAGTRLADGTIRQEHASDPDSNEAEPSGTSYAAPQVAAAAAMWVTYWKQELEKMPERWMQVEAFRRALRSTADDIHVRRRRSQPETIPIRKLNIEQLLTTPPDLGFEYRKHEPARRFWSLF